MFHKVKKYLNSIKKYRLTRGTFIRLAVLAAVVLAVVFGGKLRSFFDHSINTDLSSNKLNNSNVTRSFFALPAYGVAMANGQFQFENENESVKVNLSQNYSGPIEIKLSDSQSVRIFDQNSSDFKSDLLKSMDVSKNEESNKYVKYQSKDGRKIVYYSYQKDAKNGQKKLKNWIVYKSGDGKEKESYRIENAMLVPYQNGAVAVYYSDKFTDEKKSSGGEKEAVSPDLLIERPYYFTKEGKTVDLDWKISQEKNEISLEFTTGKNEYPITLDPTITHNSEFQFDAGSALNRTESIAGPKVQSAYHELPADEHTVGLWHMNETSNGTCTGSKDVCDSSGNGYHGSRNGTTIDTTNQKLGAGARSFNGSSDYINAGTIFPTGTNAWSDFSIEMWIKPDTVSANQILMVQCPAGTERIGDFDFYIQSDGKVAFDRFYGTNNKADRVITNNIPFTAGVWSHIAVVWQGGTSGKRRIYVNGEEQPTTSTDGINDGDWNISGTYIGGGYVGYYFAGLIDETRVSNVARTSEEIKADAQRFPYAAYNSSVMDLGVGATTLSKINWTENGVMTGDGETLSVGTSLVAQWNFNETSGTTANNDGEGTSCGGTPASCDGTLTNFTNTGGRDTVPQSGWTADNRRWGAGALSFDGSNDYVDAGSSPSLNISGNQTISVWVKSSLLVDNADIIGRWLSSSDNKKSWRLRLDSASQIVTFRVSSDGTTNSADVSFSSPLLFDGNWHQIAAKYDGTYIYIYLDGKEANKTSYSSGIYTNTLTKLIVGASMSTGSPLAYFNGIIDSTAFYSRALSDDEILSNYNSGNVEIQTRTGTSTNPDDGTWEAWKPAGTETQITSMDSDIGNWSWDSTATYIPATTANESNIKMEGTGSMKIRTGAPKVDANTVGLWHMDDTNTGVGRTVYDSSGYNNHGILSGAPAGPYLVEGISGKAKSFNGISDYISAGTNSITGTSAFSIEAWMKPGTHSNYGIGPYIGNASSGAAAYIGYVTTAQAGTSNSIGGGFYGTNYGSGITPDNNWHHVALTFAGGSGGAAKLYVDGVEKVSTTATPNLGSNSVMMGKANSGTEYWYNGLIDEVKISNVARSAEEIAESYRAGRDHQISRTISSTDLSAKNKIPFYVAADRPGTYLEATAGESAFANGEPDANTMGFWHLEEQSGSGAYIKDSSGNGNNITLGTGSSVPTFAQGKKGKARSFDGNDYINAGSASTLSPSTGYLTISSWFKTSTDGKYIVAKYNTGSPYQGYGLLIGQVVANKLGCWVGGSAWTTSNISVTDGNWHYGVCTYDGSNVRVYVDGKLDGMQAQTASLAYAANLYIGTYGGLLYFWNGVIDEVRVDDVARTPSEILQAYEVGKRTHNITIDFSASLDSGNLIASTADTSFTIDSTTYGAQKKGDNIYVGDKIIVRENYDGTEYMAQGTVSGVNVSTGAITVQSWDSGSTAPSGGYTTGAILFKWQREYWDITGPMDNQIDAVTKLTLRQTDGNEGRTVYLDDFKSLDNYLTDPTASGNITSAFNRYFQYRSVFSTSDRNVSPYLSSVSAIYTDPFQDKNVYKSRGNVEFRGNMKAH